MKFLISVIRVISGFKHKNLVSYIMSHIKRHLIISKLSNGANIFFLSFLCLIFFSCSEFQKIQKSDQLSVRYDAAIKYFEDGDYTKAGILLEELIPIIRGKKEAEKTQFYYAYCHYHQRQLVLAAYYFKNFYQTYPRSEYVEESMYMHTLSLYESSPKYNLDQTDTYKALEVIQLFVNKYPNSKHVDECNDFVDKLRVKLESKAYELAKLYYNLRYYKSAVIAFSNFNKDFPNSNYNEELAYLKIDAQYNLARISVEKKKKERLYKTIQYYENFIDLYVDSRYVKSAENIYDSCVHLIGNIKNT